MAEELKRAKALRVSKRGVFTRKKNHLQQLLDGGAHTDRLQEAYTDMAEAFKTLEGAHEGVILALEEDQMEAEETYLDALAGELSAMDVKVNTSKQTQSAQQAQEKALADEAAQKKAFEGAVAAFKAKVEGFGKPSVNLQQLITEKTISYADTRLEISKLESSQAKLLDERVAVSNMDPTADLSGLCDQFTNLVVTEVELCKRLALEYLKEDVTVLPAATTVPSGGGTRSSIGFSATKRETVMLPKFSGDEKTAFLQYPIWKKQWSVHILEYETKYRATMLLNYLDAKALEQIVGLENDYDKGRSTY